MATTRPVSLRTDVTTKEPAHTKPRGLLRRLFEKPQQTWLRKAVFQVHLWAGLLLAAYVIVIGVSGSILVFKEELMPKPRIGLGAIDFKACTARQLTHAMDLANAESNGMRAFLASCPSPANGLLTVTVREQPKRVQGAPATPGANRPMLKQRSIYVHPLTGAVVGNADREDSWVQWVEQLHVNLLLGRGGRLWNGIGASALLAVTLTGLFLWWPGVRNWTRSLKLDLRRSWKRINWDLHSVLGFWTVFFTLTWALTGMYFTWPKLFTTPVEKISPIVTANYPSRQIKQAQLRLMQPPPDRQPPPSPDVPAMIAEAQRQSPDGRLEGVFYGMGPRPVFTVYMARGILGDYSNTDFVYLDQRSGRHIYTWHRGQNHTFGDWFVWLVAPLHFGTSWGQGVKVLWSLLGLALPLLTITGMLMYWNRWLSKRWRRLGADRRP